MMRTCWIRVACSLLFFLAILSPEGARAQNRSHSFTLSPMAGTYRFEGNQSLDDGRFYSLGLGYNLGEHWGLEAVAELVDTEVEQSTREVRMVGGHLDALYHFHPQGPFVPYLVAGVGGVHFNLANNEDGIVTSGLGFKLFLNNFIALRAEVRHVLEVSVTRDLETHGVYNHLVYGGGLSFQFGGGERPPVAVDSDGDGVIDPLDRCPGTLPGSQVGEDGCPSDSDGDGVVDSLDRCPETPTGTRVDGSGCAEIITVIDSDVDGVADDLDLCPATAYGTPVDENGCPKTVKWVDSDQDGVADPSDDCPATPAGTPVNPRGCPLDSDGDGVYDLLDRCPDTPFGMEVDELGCETVSGEGMARAGRAESSAETLAEVEIEYLRDEAGFSADEEARLQDLADYLTAHPGARLVVEGHTDSVGPAAYNLKLSRIRADKVRRALIEKHGVAPERIESAGFGESQPVASNDTPEGRQKNRRVLIRLLR